MEWFWRLYTVSEKTFWNTLSKKLCSFFFISLFQLLMVAYSYHALSDIRSSLRGTGVSPQVMAGVEASIDSALYWTLGLWLLSFVFIAFMVWYLRYLIVRPLRMIIQIFNEIGAGAGDLSREIPTITYDEIRDLSLSYNRFLLKMREIISNVRLMTVRIAMDSAVTRRNVTESLGSARQQDDLAKQVRQASDDSRAGWVWSPSRPRLSPPPLPRTCRWRETPTRSCARSPTASTTSAARSAISTTRWKT